MNQQIPQQASGLSSLPAIRALAETYGLSPDHFVYTVKAVSMPKDSSDAEFVSCCLVAKEHDLNPLTKEIYFMRTKEGKIQPIVSVDGWIKKCNQHPMFDGIEFEYENDGANLTAVTSVIYRKDRSRPTKITEFMDECRVQREKQGPWDTHPKRFLRHRALIQGARIAFGFASIMAPDEFEQWQSVRDITPAKPVPVLEVPDDIPDINQDQTPAIEEKEPDNEPDDLLVDADSYVASLAEELSFCTSAEELAEIEEANTGAINRLPKHLKEKAQEIIARAKE